MDKIAIIGIGCLFPDADQPGVFWENLLQARRSVSTATVRQMGVDPQIFYDPVRGKRDKYYSIQGGFIQEFAFDPHGYRLPAAQLAALDELFQWPLTVARAALADAGYLPQGDATLNCGVVLGNLSFPTRRSYHLFAPLYYRAVETALRDLLDTPDFTLTPLPDPHAEAPDPLNTLISGYPAALTARALGLTGACFGLDAACASSLYSVALACHYLRSGAADLMLAGAVSAADPFFIHMGFSIFQAYPEEGSGSMPMDRASRGLYSGEGAGMLALKRLEDARRDGDRIYAVIEGVGLSNDGHGKHLLVPNPRGQRTTFERAYAATGLSPRDIDYIECHATGTPIGDLTELNSLEGFFGAQGARPLIGSVKSNFGHLLTAAGMAGMIKTVLAMNHGIIPATIRIENPISSQQGMIQSEQIVRAATPWPDRGPVRRAAVSAFGFGGTNAHLILSHSTQPDRTLPSIPPRPVCELAITGMGAHFGPCHDLETYGASLFVGQPRAVDLPPLRWKGVEQTLGLPGGHAPRGAYIDTFEFDFLHFRHPPNPKDQPIPQQLLMLKVADEALHDSGIQAGGNVAVLIAMGTELALHQFRGRVDLSWQIRESCERAGLQLTPEQLAALEDIARDAVHEPALVNQYTSFIGNIMASRISAHWDFSGPSFTISAEEGSVARALEVARMLLAAGDVEAVVIGAVDLAGGFEHVALRHQLAPLGAGDPAFSYGKGAEGWRIGEGAGAVVLTRAEDARRMGTRIYATIQGLAIGVSEPSAETAAGTARAALAQAGVLAQQVSYLELAATGVAAQDTAELGGLARVYIGNDRTTAVGSASAVIGHTFVAGGIAALIKTALCLYQRYLPSTHAWHGPREPQQWQGTPFYVPVEARPWLLGPEQMRVAALNMIGLDGIHAHVVLREEPLPATQPNRTPRRRAAIVLKPLLALPVVGANQAELLSGLEALERRLQAGEAPRRLMDAMVAQSSAAAGAPFALVLLGRETPELLAEIAQARQGIPTAFAHHGEWRSSHGSYLTAQPLGRNGKVAFVYPGAFNSYIGMGRGLLPMFPDLHEHLHATFGPPAVVSGDRLIYPRYLERSTRDDFNDAKHALRADTLTMIRSGYAFATTTTQALRDVAGLRPDMAFGYSMGEGTMLMALGAWRDGSQGIVNLATSPLFTQRLSGRRETVRAFLRAQGYTPRDPDDVWGVYIVAAPPEQVRAAVQGEPRLFLTHINTANECVVSGVPEDALRVLPGLKSEFFRAPFNDVIHCPLLEGEYEALLQLHALPVYPAGDTVFYTAADYRPEPLELSRVMHNISRAMIQQVDFPRLVGQVYADGARIFIESGPASTCTRWINAILHQQPHLAIAMDEKSHDPQAELARVAAKLFSHRLSFDLRALVGLPESDAADVGQPALVKTIQLGGRRLIDSILTPENRALFTNLVRVARPKSLPVQVPDTTATPAVEPAPASATHRSQSEPDMNMTPASDEHVNYLQSRQTALRSLAARIQAGLPDEESSDVTQVAILDAPPDTPPDALFAPQANPVEQAALVLRRPSNVVWDEDALLEFARGTIAKVFGGEYAAIDQYHRRVRLPTPPYLLVSRVTKIDAERGAFRPSTITTEYDIPHGAWYTVDGQAPWAISVESGQCDLLLISYIGIDFECVGERVYRLLDCTLTFMDDLPREGETLRYDITINSYARSGPNLLFFFSYECFIGDRLVLKMENGCAGFFSDEELDRGKGIIISDSEHAARARIPKRSFTPLLSCNRTNFAYNDLLALSRGNPAAVFGAAYEQCGRNPSLRLPTPQMLMLSRIVSVDPQGGPWGLGEIMAELDLSPESWFFPCHFQDDQVMAGSLMAEGCGQLMQFYMLLMGLQTQTFDARFQPIRGLPQVVRCRGQVTPRHRKLIYRLEITDIGMHPRPFARANVDIISEGKIVVNFKDLGLQLVEKDLTLSPPVAHDHRVIPQSLPPAPAAARRADLVADEAQITAFALGSHVDCFGPEYRVFDRMRAPRTPNGPLQLISRVLEIQGRRHEFRPGSSLVSEYDVPEYPWFCTENNYPTTPYSILMELGLQPCGFLSAWLGSMLIFPDQELYFRNLDGSGHLRRHVDLRGKTVTNRVTLVSSTSIQGVVIQKFTYALECEGEIVYDGDAAFGYFTQAALANQVGLDNGRLVAPWHVQQQATQSLIALRPEQFMRAEMGRVHQRLAGGRLSFLDDVWVGSGGRHGTGYVFARKRINPSDWFYRAHFHEDPVMPGSLGVEAILEAMQIAALQSGLPNEFANPHVVPLAPNRTVWKYRGQIVQATEEMRLEVHLRPVQREAGRIVMVGDASLWKEDLRIYEVQGLGLEWQA